jgi:hypothetical protein
MRRANNQQREAYLCRCSWSTSPSSSCLASSSHQMEQRQSSCRPPSCRREPYQLGPCHQWRASSRQLWEAFLKFGLVKDAKCEDWNVNPNGLKLEDESDWWTWMAESTMWMDGRERVRDRDERRSTVLIAGQKRWVDLRRAKIKRSPNTFAKLIWEGHHWGGTGLRKPRY